MTSRKTTSARKPNIAMHRLGGNHIERLAARDMFYLALGVVVRAAVNGFYCDCDCDCDCDGLVLRYA